MNLAGSVPHFEIFATCFCEDHDVRGFVWPSLVVLTQVTTIQASPISDIFSPFSLSPQYQNRKLINPTPEGTFSHLNFDVSERNRRKLLRAIYIFASEAG